MARRSKRRGDLRSPDLPYRDLGQSRTRRATPSGKVLYITTYLPRPVAIKARREIYPYPYPKQLQKRGRAIRLALRPGKKMVRAKVAVRMPRHLPLVRASSVLLTDGRINIHSYNKVKGALHAREYNRRRYSEYKGNKRKARHGQLDSRGSQSFGSVAEVYRRRGTIDEAADAALVARAIAKSRR